GLLAHLDEPFGVEAEPSAHGEHGGKRREVDRVLPLVVDNAAAPVTAVALDELPGRESRVPSGFQTADHVAVAVAEDGGQPLAFAAFGKKERAARLGVPQHATAKAERFQRRLHLGFDVAGKLAGTLGILTLRRDRDAAREIGLERSAVEIV